MNKSSVPPHQAPPIGDITLMLRNWLPTEIGRKKATIAKYEAKLAEERAAVELLLQHAAIEGLPVNGTVSSDASAPPLDNTSPVS
jgi:hypothetical protein